MIEKIIYSAILTIICTSCGLEYSAPPTPISQTDDRRREIQKYMRENFEKDSLVYESIAFGKVETLKPLSYKRLDSLYGAKYTLEREGVRNVKLEDDIEIQRQIALNDTNPVRFVENHLFSLTKGQKAEVYSASLECNQSHKILNIRINESNNLNKEELDFFKIYTFEESFLSPGFAATIAENNFYRKYKSYAQTLNADEQDAFIQQSIHVMQAAKTVQSLKTTLVVKELVRDSLYPKDRSVIKKEQFESMEELVDKNGEEEQLSGYRVIVSFQKIEDEMTYSLRYLIMMDTFFRITKSQLL
jgi:hypothetical protein